MARVSDIPTDVSTDPLQPAVGLTTSARDFATSTECLNLAQPTKNDEEEEETCDGGAELISNPPLEHLDSYIERDGDEVGILRQ